MQLMHVSECKINYFRMSELNQAPRQQTSLFSESFQKKIVAGQLLKSLGGRAGAMRSGRRRNTGRRRCSWEVKVINIFGKVNSFMGEW